MGEQQRLIFARLLVNKPICAVLDEATSALDPKNEKHLYQELQAFGITFLSVGHRESLNHYHQSILDLTTVGKSVQAETQAWSLQFSDQSGAAL